MNAFILDPGNYFTPIAARKLEPPLVLQLPICSQQDLKFSFVKKLHGEYYHPCWRVCLDSRVRPAPLDLGSWPKGAWWETTSSKTGLPIQIYVTCMVRGGGVFDLCVHRALWKGKSVWPDGRPESLKRSFLRVGAKQHSGLEWPEITAGRGVRVRRCESSQLSPW